MVNGEERHRNYPVIRISNAFTKAHLAQKFRFIYENGHHPILDLRYWRNLRMIICPSSRSSRRHAISKEKRCMSLKANEDGEF